MYQLSKLCAELFLSQKHINRDSERHDYRDNGVARFYHDTESLIREHITVL